ncbi:MAG TPA: competence/damage-inducible protein A [Bacteroidetes bacterium]|jgi:nicotinamide-nucleotide amidase|nr:competence/damage-inducible protein A [Bacteroidota bacterium]
MLAEIITIGDEILIGQTVDTNSAWLGEHLNTYGIEVIQITSINDKKESIVAAIKSAENRADIVLITGGLGPTKDDITKKVLADYFGASLIMHEGTLQRIKHIFESRGRSLIQANIDQALVPDSCEVIPNTKGTAPGMYFEKNGKIYVSMPGVPYEMKAMMENVVFEKLNKQGDNYAIVHKTITVVGVPESHLAQIIESVEDRLPSDIKLAYLPHLNLVRLRLSGKSILRSEVELMTDIDTNFEKIKELIGNVWFKGDQGIAEIIGTMLKANKQTIGTIESCSGGFVAHSITANAGSSAYYKGSLLTYAYETKVRLADINQDVLNNVGAVSEEVCEAMAKNAKQKLDVDYCISTTGIAGPDGGTADKPVGLVYIGLAKPDGSVEVKKCEFHGTRLQIIERTAYTSLDMVRQAIDAAR